MKVVQIIPAFSVGGAEIMCENLIYGLKECGVQVIVVSLYDFKSAITERLEQSGIKIQYLGKKKGLDLSMIRKLRRLFIKEKPDAIHTHLYATKYAIPAARQAKIKKRIHTVHSVAQRETGKVGKILNRIFIKHYGLIPVALSRQIKDTVLETYSIKRNTVPIIYNGINLSKCMQKSTYAIENCDNLKILHIGRFSKEKNHQGLIEAFAIFHQKYPNALLQLIGTGETQEIIKNQAQILGIDKNVQFLGLKDNIYPYLQGADMFVLPSLYEGIPMTLIEAMGTGLPIIATCVGGVPDMITDEENGLLVTLDINDIVNALIRLASNENLRSKLGRNALLRAEDFSALQMAEEYIKLYID